MFTIRMGIPEMEQFWTFLKEKVRSGAASTGEEKQYRLIGKALVQLANNPRHPGLQSHEISALSVRYGQNVWESYLQNNTPAAGRLFWTIGPGRGEITVIGLEPHPNDGKSNAYKKVTLSSMGRVIE